MRRLTTSRNGDSFIGRLHKRQTFNLNLRVLEPPILRP